MQGTTLLTGMVNIVVIVNTTTTAIHSVKQVIEQINVEHIQSEVSDEDKRTRRRVLA